jgi:hypothetical protein
VYRLRTVSRGMAVPAFQTLPALRVARSPGGETRRHTCSSDPLNLNVEVRLDTGRNWQAALSGTRPQIKPHLRALPSRAGGTGTAWPSPPTVGDSNPCWCRERALLVPVLDRREQVRPRCALSLGLPARLGTVGSRKAAASERGPKAENALSRPAPRRVRERSASRFNFDIASFDLDHL